jgi:hypothetical protein
MVRTSLLLVLCWYVVPVSGQKKPDFLPEDLASDRLRDVRCYCVPGVQHKSAGKGVELSYTLTGSTTYRQQNTPLAPPFSATRRNDQLLFSLKVPVLNRPGFKMLVGARFVRDQYLFSRLGLDFHRVFSELDGRSLKSTSYDLIFFKPLNERAYTALRFKYGFSGNYRGVFNFDPENHVVGVMGFFASKKDDDHEWGAGLSYSHSFRRSILLPVFLLNRNFSSRWGLESILPVNIFMRYNLRSNLLFLGGVEYMSQSFRVRFTDAALGAQDYAVNHSALLASVMVERRLPGMVGLFLKAGYQKNFGTDFRGKSIATDSFDAGPTGSPFIRFGLFLAKPR